MSAGWADLSTTETIADDPAALLDDVEDFLSRFVAFPSEHASVAVALWVAHTHVLEAFDSTPRLAALSPEPGSGKTRLLEVVELLVPRPMMTVNVSAAALFRRVADADSRPTVLLDEADTYFGARSAKEHEDLRGLVNAGHRRKATATRCVARGNNVEVEEYPAFAAVALAGLNDLPDTIMSRAVVLRMRRRARHEEVEPFRERLHGGQGEALRERLTEWAATALRELSGSYPDLPHEIVDRPADVWEPLITIADAVGGDWPHRARVTAVTAVTESRETQGETLGVRLLHDIRDIFTSTGNDKMPTVELLSALNGLEEAPWGDLRGKPLDARSLSRYLNRYGIGRCTYRDGTSTHKGYQRTDFIDAWSRYLVVTDRDAESPKPTPTHKEMESHPSPLWEDAVTPVTPVTPQHDGRPF